jgi:hypothetical protein
MSNDAASPNVAESPEERLSTLLRSLSRIPSAVASSPLAGTSDTAAAASSPTSSSQRAHRRQQRRDVQSRHATMLDGLIRSLDIVAYAQISILYYMEYGSLRHLPLFHSYLPAATPSPGSSSASSRTGSSSRPSLPPSPRHPVDAHTFSTSASQT